MFPTVDIVVLGHLGCNPFWNEQTAVRPAVATTTLVRAGDRKIIVDPSLPGEMLAGRLGERCGLSPDAIDTVFLTSFHPTHRRGIELFEDATWFISQAERDAVSEHLNNLLESDDAHSTEVIEAELAMLGRLQPVEDQLADGVDIFPSPGVTPGLCSLLIAGLQTTVIAGDAVLTREHFERQQVSEQAVDREQALESLAEMYEIADIIVPGHDNLFVVQGRL